MKLNINNREVELHFGVRFVRELDKVAGMTANGVSMGMGLSKTLPALEQGDPVALENALYAATYESVPRVTMNEIDAFLDNSKTDVAKLNNEVFKAVTESNVIKPTAKKLKITMKNNK